MRGVNGKQPGNPALAAQAIINIVETEKPPLRFLLGSDALGGARQKLAELATDYDTWESTTVNCDFND